MDFALVVIILVILFLPDLNFKIKYKNYSKIKNSKKLSGQEIASKILKEHDLDNIYIVETEGYLSDHYDSKRKAIRLSKLIYDKESISSLAIASNMACNAISQKENNLIFKIRTFILPVIKINTYLSYFIILVGFILQLFNYINIGIAITIVGLLFQIINLPVIFNASKNGLEELIKLKIINDDEYINVKKLLTSNTITYIAGILASIIQIIRLLLIK